MRSALLAVSVVLVSGAAASAAVPARIACPAALAGSWYVLVRYRDMKSSHPDRLHWRDRAWTIQESPEQLRWTDYPEVVFDHSEGRYAGSPSRGRRIPDWKPDDAQLAEVRRGLTVNVRPARTKVLVPAGSGRWRSPEPSGGAAAGFVSYEQRWTVAQEGEACVLIQTDVFGEGAGGDAGRTEYRILGKEGDGALHGTYERDGHLHGTALLLPAGPLRPRKSAAPPGVKPGSSSWPHPR